VTKDIVISDIIVIIKNKTFAKKKKRTDLQAQNVACCELVGRLFLGLRDLVE
jgi:hypothetical protein